MGEWLKEMSLASQVAISIKAKDAEASQGREADVLWRNKGDLWVMELKVALPDGKTSARTSTNFALWRTGLPSWPKKGAGGVAILFNPAGQATAHRVGQRAM